MGCQALLQGVFTFQGNLPDPGIEPVSLHLLQWQVGSLPPPGKPLGLYICLCLKKKKKAKVVWLERSQYEVVPAAGKVPHTLPCLAMPQLLAGGGER